MNTVCEVLFSVKPQHESAIGILISPPFEPPSHLPPHPAYLFFMKVPADKPTWA